MKFLIFLRQFLVKMGSEIGLYYKMKYLKQATHLYSRINTACHFQQNDKEREDALIKNDRNKKIRNR